MLYKIYIRYALSGVCIKYVNFKTHDDFYKYIGKLYMSSLEKIDRVDYHIFPDIDAQQKMKKSGSPEKNKED